MSQTQQVEHTDSISSQDPHSDPAAKKTKSRRPPNTAFRQQRLKAWQPILTPKTVLPIFFIVGIIFAPIGGLLLKASSQVQEIAIDYTNCATDAPPASDTDDSSLHDIPSGRVSYSFDKAMLNQPKWGQMTKNHTWQSGKTQVIKICKLLFIVPNDVDPPVLFYYRLNNFYQNHRRYVKSFDVNQLKGEDVSVASIRSGECDPLDVAPAANGKPERPYYPCGLIANSMFNDTFENLIAKNAPKREDGQAEKPYEFKNKGISWSTEGDLYGTSKYSPGQVVPPPNWQEQYPEDGYDSLDKLPDLHTWEEFQVWMRTAGLPTFSKLAKRNDNDVLKAGTYTLSIQDHFPVEKYGGKKSILISTRTVMGGKNPFLGIAYVVVGGLCILLGTIFTLTHLVKPRKLGDHTYLSWNNNEPSTATTTGRATRPGDTA